MRLRLISVATSLAVLGGAMVLAAPSASACSGLQGLGTAVDPWLIGSDADVPLVVMCMPSSGYFALTADVSVTTTSVFPAAFSGDLDGRGHTITFDGVTDVVGVFAETNTATADDLLITSINASTLAMGAGWLTSRDTDSTFIFIRSTGDISMSGGGIVGAVADGTHLVACASSGAIGDGAGGLVGAFTTDVYIERSSSSGVIGNNAGGLIGYRANGTTVDRSFSTGTIGLNSGGIIGSSANWNATGVTTRVTNSFSTGSIGTYGGGIIGYFANGTATASQILLEDVYSTGAIGHGAGGIVGGEANYWGMGEASVSVNRAFSLGSIGSDAGGIIASGSNDQAMSAQITVADVYSAGDMTATSGGIIGAGAAASGAANITLFDAYSAGASPITTNGIFVANSGQPPAINTYAESANSSSGFSDTNFATVTSGITPWGAGEWGSCQVNTPPYLQATFSRNPCRATPTRTPSISATFNAGDATYHLSAASIVPDSRLHFMIGNSIAGLPSDQIEVYSEFGVLRSRGQDCIEANPCVIGDGWMFAGGTQRQFTAKRLGTVHVDYRRNPIDPPESVGDFQITAQLRLTATRDGVDIRYRGHTAPALDGGMLTVKWKRPNQVAFHGSERVAVTSGRFAWVMAFDPRRHIELYVTDGVTESNRVSL